MKHILIEIREEIVRETTERGGISNDGRKEYSDHRLTKYETYIEAFDIKIDASNLQKKAGRVRVINEELNHLVQEKNPLRYFSVEGEVSYNKKESIHKKKIDSRTIINRLPQDRGYVMHWLIDVYTNSVGCPAYVNGEVWAEMNQKERINIVPPDTQPREEQVRNFAETHCTHSAEAKREAEKEAKEEKKAIDPDSPFYKLKDLL